MLVGAYMQQYLPDPVRHWRDPSFLFFHYSASVDKKLVFDSINAFHISWSDLIQC